MADSGRKGRAWMADKCGSCERQRPVPVGGIWIRKIGGDVQVLAEVSGLWRLLAVEPADGAFSHIIEPGGILGAPADEVTADGHLGGPSGKP